jgi:signal transduction histidine kinase
MVEVPHRMGNELDFKLLFQESPEVLLVLLPDAPRYTMVAATNARWHATHTTGETLGRGLFEVFPDNPDDPTASGTSNLRASLERVVKTRQPDTMPVQKYDIRGPDGTFEAKYWSPKNLPVLSPSGEVLYILHRVEDVTDLVRASALGDELRGRTRQMEREVLRRSHELEAALRQLRDAHGKLAELDIAKTEFFSNISHEFRTPLTLILATLQDELAESAAAASEPTARGARLEMAYRNCLRLLKLVNSLLDFARIEAGRVQALYEPTDLALLTGELASHFTSAAERAGLELTIDCSPLPEPVYVDREMWEKIVLNLLSNAFKHTFRGGITVRLSGLEGGGARLCVEDSGVGIPAEELPKLFERFHRVKGAASRTHEGTGIGLSLVRELVQLHTGDVRIESEVGKGSRFFVTLKGGSAHLPAEKVRREDSSSAGFDASADDAGAAGDRPDAVAGAQSAPAYVQEALHWLPSAEANAAGPGSGTHSAEEEAVTRAAAKESGSPARARVLLADDNSDMRRYIGRILGEFYDVVAVADGQAALEAARAAQPDLILSDIMMPRLDGFGLVKALRADERTRTLPVILVSARAGEESAVESLDAGADDYLVKPFSARELLARVRTHVDMARLRREWESELSRRVEERTAELRRAQQAALQQERLSALGQMASGIAHDINNAISPVALYVESLLESDQTLSSRARQYLPIVLRSIDDVASTVARMREFYRAREPQVVLLPADLNSVVQQVVDLTRARWSDMPLQRGIVISVATELDPELPAASGIESEIREALTNLIFNAVDAMPEGGTLTLRTAVVDGSRVCVEVGDTGVGMDAVTRQRCLEPFFTTKGERGTGLGLAMVYGFVQRHGAEIQIESAPGLGTKIRVLFPVPLESEQVVQDAAEVSAAPLGSLRILVIDDDPLVLDALRETLEGEGHVVVATADPREGVKVFIAARGSEPFGAVFTDLGMPHLDGRAVAKAVKEASPETPVILLTGWGQRLGADADGMAHVDRVLGKPPKARELRAALAQCCGERLQAGGAGRVVGA